MTFVESLGGHNGQTVFEVLGGHNGDMLHEIMATKEIEIEDNPLSDLAMDFDIGGSVDLLGKVVGDLQSDMRVDGCKIRGTSKYVTGYTGFSGDTKEQEGNYVAFHISVGDLVIGTSVTVKVNGVTMDPDGLHVMRFRDGSKNPKAIVTAIKDGHTSITKTFDFTSVMREPKDEEE